MRFNHIELLNVGDGHDIVIETAYLSECMTLKVYDQKDAELIVNNFEIPLKWTDKARTMIEKLDEVKAVELFGLINI